MTRYRYLLTDLLLVAMPLPQPVQGADDAPAPKVEVKLVAEHTAVVPGKVTTLAVSFKIERGWHIYWQNPGEGGLNTSFDWHLPEGYKVGPMRFPPPKRHVDSTGAHTFILEGEPAFLTELTIPPSAKAGDKAKLTVDVGWLVCKEACVRGEKSIAIDLPVVAGEDQAKETGENVFKYAARTMPAPADKAKYLRGLTAKADVEKVAPGDKFRVQIVLDVQPGYHLQSHAPLGKFDIPTDLFPYKVRGLNYERAQFPAGAVEEASPGIKASVYRDKVVVTLPATAGGTLEGDKVDIGGVITYQACSDESKTCFPPASAEWRFSLPVVQGGEAGTRSAPPPSPRGPIETPEPPTPIPPDVEAAKPEGADPAQTIEPTVVVSQHRGWLQRFQEALLGRGIFGYLILAFIGGFILNFMPCVLPVISLKILSFVQQAKEHRFRIFTLGSAFAAGILVSFLVLGLLILGVLKGLGVSQISWGGLFQRPAFAIVLASIVTVLSLSLFGVFTLSPPRFINDLGGKVKEEGHLGAFAMGLLATVLGTACTAPFLSVVIASALQQPPRIALLIFITAGVGMAWPYVLLAAVPAWVKLIPKPGPWMKTFEHAMGFLMLGTVVWLLNPLPYQIGIDGLIWTIVFLLIVSAAAWCYGRVEYGSSMFRRVSYYGSAVGLLSFGVWFCYLKEAPPSRIPWQPYRRELAVELVEQGKTVFVDYTAEWCVNCKANERWVLNTDDVSNAIEKLGVVPMKADYTNFDPEITEDLERFKRSGVPMYVILPANRPEQPILLSEILTTGTVLEGLQKAGPSKSPATPVAAANP